MAAPEPLLDQIQTYTSRISTNISATASRYTIQDYIRLVIIIGAYCLLRPYLLALGGKFQAKDHDRELDLDELSSPAAVKSRKAVDALRGVKDQVPDDTDSEGEDEKGADWGRGARRKQRLMVRRLLEETEKQRYHDEEDKDIQEFLED
jgi:hypothetical protein